MTVTGLCVSLVCCVAPLLTASEPELQLTIIYDNTTTRSDLKADWGFSTLVEFRGKRVLFDTGNNPAIFDANLQVLGIEKSSIQTTVISHRHPEHGPAFKLLPAGVATFLDSFSSQSTGNSGPTEIAPGIFTTGAIPGVPPEQALVIETAKGLVMLVGCSHPGLPQMIKVVEKQRGQNRIRMVIGGLHLYDQSADQIRPIVAGIKKLNVEAIVPVHCSGETAIKLLREAYGDRCGTGGAGKKITLK